VGTAPASQLPAPKLIEWMVGRELGEQFPRHATRAGPVRFELRDFSVYPRGRFAAPAVCDATLAVRAGEIVGIGGLQGSGASELLLGAFGSFGNRTTGRLLVEGRKVHINSPRRAIDAGLALVTNDRKETGLVLALSIMANITLASLPKLSIGGWRRPSSERRAAATQSQSLGLRAASLEMPTSALSGGNQQKVAIAKWLETGPRVLLLDEPTRGIDIGAKREIYELLNRLTEQGIAILLITSELPELLALSDRVVVLHRGRITAELARDEATPATVLAAAMGEPATPDLAPGEPTGPGPPDQMSAIE
jgi:ABC-type sugar transport system ATPase subunit